MVKATGQGGCTIDEETTRGVDQPEGDSICFVSDAFPESAVLSSEAAGSRSGPLVSGGARGGDVSSVEELIARLTALRQSTAAGQRAPHKPLLVLLALGQLANGGPPGWSSPRSRLGLRASSRSLVRRLEQVSVNRPPTHSPTSAAMGSGSRLRRSDGSGQLLRRVCPAAWNLGSRNGSQGIRNCWAESRAPSLMLNSHPV